MVRIGIFWVRDRHNQFYKCPRWELAVATTEPSQTQIRSFRFESSNLGISGSISDTTTFPNDPHWNLLHPVRNPNRHKWVHFISKALFSFVPSLHAQGCICIDVYIYIYIYIMCLCIYTYIHIRIYIYICYEFLHMLQPYLSLPLLQPIAYKHIHIADTKDLTNKQ